jgi:putative salt-induced outer membrane protein YdiY
MGFNRVLAAVITVLSLLITAGNVMGDEIWLKNGDHISGNVFRMENKILIFKTPYAGEISVRWEEIANLRTDVPIAVVLSDETSGRGVVSAGEGGKVSVRVDNIEEPLTFDLAQVAVINPKPPKPALKLNARVNVGIAAQRGNTDTDNYHLDGEFVARTEKNRYTVGTELNREKTDGERTSNNTLGYIKYDHFLSQKWYFYSNALFEQDEFKDLDLRTTVGVGLGHQFFETPLTNLSIEAGLSYVNEDYDKADDNSYSAGRWALKYDRYLIEKVVQFFHYHEGYVSLEDTEKIVFRSRTGLRVPLYERFIATAQYNFDWDSDPAPGVERVDATYLLSLGYQY